MDRHWRSPKEGKEPLHSMNSTRWKDFQQTKWNIWKNTFEVKNANAKYELYRQIESSLM